MTPELKAAITAYRQAEKEIERLSFAAADELEKVLPIYDEPDSIPTDTLKEVLSMLPSGMVRFRVREILEAREVQS